VKRTLHSHLECSRFFFTYISHSLHTFLDRLYRGMWLLENHKKGARALVRTLVWPNLSRAEPSLAPFNNQWYQSRFILKAESKINSRQEARFVSFLFYMQHGCAGTTAQPSQNYVQATSVQQPFRLFVRFAWARTRPILGALPRPLVDRDVHRMGWIPHIALLDTESSPATLTRPSHFESWISTTLAATPGRLMARAGSGMSKLRL